MTSLAPGAQLGPYAIIGPLGAGGMGEVYRARDPRLGRDVALKILPEGVASDPDRLRRFEREARAAGQLNHANILTVHDTGTAAGRAFLVTELLEGETLRARMSGRKLPLALALNVARQIARGLEAAHAKDVVHRDLKPENIFVTTDGGVKILDFGLAKLPTRAEPGGVTNTALDDLTEPGLVMGTPSYMSPEQVRGGPIDHRTDIFALGAILYEMLSGQRAFTGKSTPDVMSAVLRQDVPDLGSTDAQLPPVLSRIVQRCLEKTAAARFQSAADLAFALEALADSGPRMAPSTSVTAGRPGPWRRESIAWIAAGVLAIVGVSSLAVSYFRRPSDDNRPLTTAILPPQSSLFGALVVSPDGRWLAFTDASAGGKDQLWIRGLDAPANTRALPGTTGATNPFWAPDSRSLGFFADNQLKTIAIDGEVPRTIASVADNRGGTWNRDGVIVFGSIAGPLSRVSATERGAPMPVTVLGAKDGSHRWPYFLPDGKHFLYFVRSTDPDLVGTYVASLDNRKGIRLVESVTNAMYAAPGMLLFVGRDHSLMAQPFDAASITTTAPAVQLVKDAGFRLALNRGSFSASDTGLLVYGAPEESQLAWFDRSGKALGSAGPSGFFSQVVLSSDDTRAVVERPDPQTGANDIVVADLARDGVQARFTTSPASDSRAIWMPTTNLIVYGSNRTGTVYDLYAKPGSGPGDEELLFSSGESKIPTGGSPDGRLVLFESTADATRKSSIWALPLGDRHPYQVLASGFNEAQARISPDGRWVAYTSDKDGSFEIYVADASGVLVSDAGARHRSAMSSVRVSTGGGTQPVWRRDGKISELYYLAPDRRLMMVSIAKGSPFSASAPRALFSTHVTSADNAYQNYAASIDGQRFLILVQAEQTAATIVMNWPSMLKRAK